ADGTAGDEAEAPATPESRVVVVGDSDFVANYALGIQGNGDLFMNAVNWLAQQENLIAIRPRDPTDRRVTLTASQTLGVFLLSIVVVPATVFGAGIYAWWRRRQ
ncbi:MAG: ABC transporter, partial [Acidobacteria bacterium]|nr:ABC transporter [Acidobacteriota bacterium]